MSSVETPLFYHLMPKDRESVFEKVFNNSNNGKRIELTCRDCGACCLAFDIPGVKKHGEVCPYLVIDAEKLTCAIYEDRPSVCREYDCGEDLRRGMPADVIRRAELFSAKQILQDLKQRSEPAFLSSVAA